MFDDFKRPPEKRPVRIDTFRDTLPPPVDNQDTNNGENPPEEPVFRSPDEINRFNPDFLQPADSSHMLPEHTEENAKKRFFLFRKPNFTKKQWIIITVVLVTVTGGAVSAFFMTRKDPPPPVKAPVKVAPKPAPKPILSPLTGLPVTLEQQIRPVTGVMIENSREARPQSGLKDAGVVFEAIAEYGITRFLALYQEANPSNVGPVRSARPYYLDWVMAFDANYAHVGGSPEALARIKEIGVRDLDQFFNSGAYRRVNTRFAPHNVYTSIDSLVSIGNAKGYTTSTFTPLVRKEKESPSKAPTVKTINLAVSSAFYNVSYAYDPATNGYKRTMGGSPHTDMESGQQIEPKVVIALAMPYSLMADGYHSQYGTIGSGNMLLFQDGTVTSGTWSKGGPKEQFIFKDGAGADMKLNPGQTWITVLSDITKATYAP